jgi:hypothetical protein
VQELKYEARKAEYEAMKHKYGASMAECATVGKVFESKDFTVKAREIEILSLLVSGFSSNEKNCTAPKVFGVSLVSSVSVSELVPVAVSVPSPASGSEVLKISNV